MAPIPGLAGNTNLIGSDCLLVWLRVCTTSPKGTEKDLSLADTTIRSCRGNQTSEEDDGDGRQLDDEK